MRRWLKRLRRPRVDPQSGILAELRGRVAVANAEVVGLRASLIESADSHARAVARAEAAESRHQDAVHASDTLARQHDTAREAWGREKKELEARLAGTKRTVDVVLAEVERVIEVADALRPLVAPKRVA
jgi:hypothetical protein